MQSTISNLQGSWSFLKSKPLSYHLITMSYIYSKEFEMYVKQYPAHRWEKHFN